MVAHPGPPQIRTCPSKASGSSRCGAVPHTIHCLAVTRWEVRCPRRDSGVGSTTRRPLRSTESGRARSPASTLLWGTPTPCRPSRRTSFPSLGDTIVSSQIRPHRLGTRAVDQPGVGKPGSDRQSRWRRQGLPSSREALMIIRHVLRPRCDQARLWVQVELMPGSAPACVQDEGSRQGNFEAQSHSV